MAQKGNIQDKSTPSRHMQEKVLYTEILSLVDAFIESPNRTININSFWCVLSKLETKLADPNSLNIEDNKEKLEDLKNSIFDLSNNENEIDCNEYLTLIAKSIISALEDNAIEGEIDKEVDETETNNEEVGIKFGTDNKKLVRSTRQLLTHYLSLV